MASPEQVVTYQELVQLIDRHRHLSKMEILAIAANVVGKLIALQDQRTITVETAMTVVLRNIEEGNKEALALINTPGGTC